MRNWICIGLLAILAGGNNSWAQTILSQAEYQPGAAHRCGLHVRSEFGTNSDAITNQFLFGFIDGRTVTESDKDKIMDRTAPLNRAGFDINNGVAFSWRGKNQAVGSGFWVSVFDRQHLNASFTDDMLEVALYGNKRFAGQEAVFDGFSLNFYRYQQAEFGIARALSPRSRVGVGLALIKGEENLEMESDFMRLYTSPLGDELRLNTLLLVNETDTTNKGFEKFNGWGTAISGFWETTLSSPKANNRVVLRLEAWDIGFINWNSNSVRYNIDTLYRYEGTEIVDIFDLQDSVFEAITADTILDELTEGASQGSYTSYLPPQLQASVRVFWKSFELWTGVHHRFTANYLPYAFAQGRYTVAKHWKVGLLAGAGGFGTANLGMDVTFESSHWMIQGGTRNLEGVISPRNFGGTNLFVQLNRYF